MSERTASWDVPKIDDVPTEQYERVVAEVAAVAEQRAAGKAERTAVAAWIADELGGLDHIDGRDEQALRTEIERRGFAPDEVHAVLQAGHEHAVRSAARPPLVEPAMPVGRGIPPIALPTLWKPPYGGSMTYTVIHDETNFTAGDPARLPIQPNGQSTIIDAASGQVGCNLIQEHTPGILDFSSGSCNITQACLVGVWAYARSASQSVWASVGLESGAFGCLGNVHMFGSGSARLSNYLVIEAYWGGAPAGHPGASIYTSPISYAPASVDGDFPSNVPAQTLTPSATLRVPAGTWFWLMVGNAEILTASAHHAELTVSTDFTWKVNSISGYL